MAVACHISSSRICRGPVAKVELRADAAACVLGDQTRLLLWRFLGSRVVTGDEIAFAVPTEDEVGTEILVTKHAVSRRDRYLYQAPIGYVSQPKPDKRNQQFVSARVHGGRLGLGTVVLPCEALCEYFYRSPHSRDRGNRSTLYHILRISPNASAAELRVAFRLRDLELTTTSAPTSERVALERAFNIVGQPELRACYDGLLADPEDPALFPYGGFGSLLVAGELSRDGQTFFARRILAFSPELGVAGFVYHCADVSFMTIGLYVATCDANSNSGLILPSFMRCGTPHGISGNISWKPRSRSKARLCRALNTACDAEHGTS